MLILFNNNLNERNIKKNRKRKRNNNNNVFRLNYGTHKSDICLKKQNLSILVT